MGVFFFFSSRRRHTRWNCDWSSDVCSSDLHPPPLRAPAPAFRRGAPEQQADGGQDARVGQRVGPEELVVRGPPDLFGGIPAGQPTDGGGQALCSTGAVTAGELRA